MKKTSVIIIILLLVIAVGLFFLPEENDSTDNELWKNATYTEDTLIGVGKNNLILTVEAGDKSIDITVRTDMNNVGEVLKKHNVISGEEGPYGIYVKVVNGIEADYDKDQSYWSFEKDGEAMLTGVDSTEFKDGEHFELVRTK